MNKLNTLLTAIAFSLAGVAVHANAAQTNCSNGNACFQSTPVAGKSGAAQLAEDGYGRTPLGMQQNPSLAENGSARTPLGQQLQEQQKVAEDGSSRTPRGLQQNQTLAENGSARTPLGMQLEGNQEPGVA
ncbi:hypothetical secreted protein [Pseudomonas knackmussii B13]|uniref:Hypothetical secreted protein n=1 Tax=Pseudomonas knackmussii (strain DSM 6978 / CCUG 54928 / LMG 23759 / B13) TaxID=1301098 RepID=A0A024HLY5_PSEKB|nr:hypothetical protein [Pseudomonas knackmussii]CDF85614.1 hypothetical secreted protein [Pseudomonas knackmussii B13]